MTLLRPLRATVLAAALTTLGALSACGGGGGGGSPTVPTAPATTLALSAASSTATAGGKPVLLTATVSDASPVSWQLAAGSPGSLSATSGASVSYVPPAGGVSAAVTVTITASANGASQSVVLTVSPDPDPPRLALIAGDMGGPGTIDGVGARARLGAVSRGTFDADGNLYLVESDAPPSGGSGGRVAFRKVTPSAAVSTLLNTTTGEADGEPGVGTVYAPSSLAAGPDGSVYFLDGASYALADTSVPLRKLDRNGKLSTITRLALKTGEQLSLASGGGKLYAVHNDRLSLIGSDGSLSLLAGAAGAGGTAVDGPGASARFVRLSAAAADPAGNLYLIDGRAVRKYALNGAVSTVAGVAADTGSAAADGSGSVARFVAPYGIGVNAAGNIVLGDQATAADRNQMLLRSVTPAGVVSSATLTAPGVNPNLLLVNPKGAVLIGRGYEIAQLAADGSSSTPFAGAAGSATRQDGSGTLARFIAPNAMAADSAGNLYLTDRRTVTDYAPHAVESSGFYLRKVTPAGVVTTLADMGAAGYPSGIAVDRNNTVYLSIRIPGSSMTGLQPGGGVYKLQADGSVTLLAGAASNGGSYAQVDGAGSAARFVMPILEGADADGNLYVTDTATAPGGGRAVRKVTPAGVVTTIAAMPAGLKNVADQAGNLYSADTAAHVVYRTTPAGVKTVVAGTLGQRGTQDGALPGYLLQPTALVATGPYTLALVSGNAVMKLVVPH